MEIYLHIYLSSQSDTSLSIGTLCGNKMPTRCNRLYLLQILLYAQHVSGNTMPIIRSSRVLYRWSLPVVFRAYTRAPDDGHSIARNMLSMQ